MKRDPSVFIEHILDSIEKIEAFIKNISKEDFTKNILLQDGLVRRIEIIGEAVKNLPKEFQSKYPYIQWSDIAGMRDKLMHHYFGIDIEVVWKTVKEDIPDLKQKILKIKEDLEEQEKEREESKIKSRGKR